MFDDYVYFVLLIFGSPEPQLTRIFSSLYELCEDEVFE